MDHERAEQDRQERDLDQAGMEADQDGDAADEFGKDDRPGESRRQADLAQESRQSPAR